MDSARHVIKRIAKSRSLSFLECHDVTSVIYRSRIHGGAYERGGVGCHRRGARGGLVGGSGGGGGQGPTLVHFSAQPEVVVTVECQ